MAISIKPKQGVGTVRFMVLLRNPIYPEHSIQILKRAVKIHTCTYAEIALNIKVRHLLKSWTKMIRYYFYFIVVLVIE